MAKVFNAATRAIARRSSGGRGCVSAVDSQGRTIWIVDAHRDDGKRFVVHADEKLTAFLELESVIRACGDCKPGPQTVLNNQ
jgi:hypothetical protein